MRQAQRSGSLLTLSLLQLVFHSGQGLLGTSFVQMAAGGAAYANGAQRVIARLDWHTAGQNQETRNLGQARCIWVGLNCLGHAAGGIARRS